MALTVWPRGPAWVTGARPRLLAAAALWLVLVGVHAAEAQSPGDRPNQVAVEYGYTYFDTIFDPWHLASLEYTRSTLAGPVIGRANYARRFDASGLQLEVDAYPTLHRGWYAYLNAGYGLAGSFPDWRAGGEVFASLPAAWEASAGFRHLQFGEGYTMWTGSVGKYHGNSWFSVRPFLLRDQGDLSWTILFAARRYFTDAQHYLGVLAAYGSTPGDVLTELELERQNDLKVEATGKHPLGAGLRWQWRASIEREELNGDQVRHRVGVTLRFERVF